MKWLTFICLLVAAPNWTKSKNLPPNVNHEENGIEGVIGYNGNQLWKAYDTDKEEESEVLQKLYAKAPGHRLTWDAYHRLDVIYEYLDFLKKTYPKLCKVQTIGYTHERRPIQLLKISNGNPNNKAIWIDGGIHAREWVSPATATFVIEHFVSNFTSQPAAVQSTDWYVVPVLNPDGYEYSHINETTRLWRKNRRVTGEFGFFGQPCDGVDLNRNFGYKWGERGTVTDPCENGYAGSESFSEPETLAVKQFFENSKATWKGFVSFHSYGQVILYPWGYSDLVAPPDEQDLDYVGRKMAQEIQSSGGPAYDVTSIPAVIPGMRRVAPGSACDWAKGALNIKYSYGIELRPKGASGFELPPSEIIATAFDGLAALTVLAEV